MKQKLFLISFFYTAVALAANNNDLLRAAMHGNLEEVKKCVSRGDYLEAKNNVHYTPLLMAIRFGHVNVVKYLLRHGANVRALTAFGLSVFEANRNVPAEDLKKITIALLHAGAPYEDHLRNIEEIIGESPDAHMARYIEKLVKHHNLSMNDVMTAAAKHWLKLEETDKAMKVLTLQSGKTELSDMDIGRLLGCVTREIKKGLR